MDVNAITLGQPVLPGRLPFSKPKVNWLLQEKTAKNTGGVDLLVFLHTCVLLNRLGGDGCGRLRGVVLLNVSCGSGDGSPCLA